MRQCLDCFQSISDRGNRALRCKACALKYNKMRESKWHNIKWRNLTDDEKKIHYIYVKRLKIPKKGNYNQSHSQKRKARYASDPEYRKLMKKKNSDYLRNNPNKKVEYNRRAFVRLEEMRKALAIVKELGLMEGIDHA